MSEKTLTPPTHCPFCGHALTVVRHIMATFYEVACEREGCERTAVISVDDFAAI